MGPIFNIPERCLLAQAALYVGVKGTVPIPDDIYIAAPEKFLMGSTDLVRVLRAKSITARASLSEAFRAEEPFSSIKDWQTSFPWPLIEDVEIDETLWTHEQADFANSRLVANSVWITHLYKVPSPDPDEVLTTWWDELKTKKIETAFLFTNITLATETFSQSSRSGAFTTFQDRY